MDIYSVINSPNADNVQLVVSAADLKKCFDDLRSWCIKCIKEETEPSYYTREQLQELLHISAPTLISYRRKGLLPDPVTIEGRVLYEKSAVRHALENGTIKIKSKIYGR